MLYCTLPELTGVDVEEGALVKNGSGGRLGTGVRMADVDPKKGGIMGRTQGRTQSTRGGRGLLNSRMPAMILEYLT